MVFISGGFYETSQKIPAVLDM